MKVRGIRVVLLPHEVEMAAIVGVRRQVESIAQEKLNKYGARREDEFKIHIQGAVGELAFAKAVGLYWGGSVNTFKNGGDVGVFQVRTRMESYDLLVRDSDRSTDIFVLVLDLGRTRQWSEYLVVGWLWGWEAKEKSHHQRRYGGRELAWFIPQSELRSMSFLLNEVSDATEKVP